jgi:hypothetical protein
VAKNVKNSGYLRTTQPGRLQVALAERLTRSAFLFPGNVLACALLSHYFHTTFRRLWRISSYRGMFGDPDITLFEFPALS